MQCPKCRYEPTLAEIQADAERCPKCRTHYSAPPAKQSSALANGLRGAKAAVKAGRQARAQKFYCQDCGALTAGVTRARGSTLVELILWLTFLLPGLIYSVWRLSTKHEACEYCHSPRLIPSNSPRARQQLGR